MAVRLLSVAADQLLIRRHQHYLKLVSAFECYPLPCEKEIFLSGQAHQIVVAEIPGRSVTAREVVVSDEHKELLRIPYDRTDGTLRTHIAIRPTPDGASLVVFSGARGHTAHIREAHSIDSDGLQPATPGEADEELLNAMAATDDTGTFHTWVLYRLFRKAALGGALVLLVLMSLFLYAGRIERRRAA